MILSHISSIENFSMKKCVFLVGYSRQDLGLMSEIWASGLGFGPQGWDFGLKAGIWPSWLEFGPQGWELSLKAGIWAIRLGSGLQG